MSSYRRLFRLWAGKRSAEEEMDEEIDAHLRLSAEEFVRRGATAEEAMRMAEARFGDLGRARNELRAGARDLDTHRRQRDTVGALLSDLRFAFTQMRRAPGFTALAILTLALGIGLTTATFILVNGVLLQPLPFDRPEQLVELFSRDSAGEEYEVVSAGDLEDWYRGSNTLATAAVHAPRAIVIGLENESIRVPGQLVSPSFFEVIRPELLLGRALVATDVAARENLIVISEALWHRLGSDSSLVHPVRVEGLEMRVVGVVRSGGEYPVGTEVWAGVVPAPETGAMRNNVNWAGVARLKDGVTIPQARDDLDRVAHDVRLANPLGLYSYGVGVRLLQDYVVGNADRMLTLLMLAVSAVLLIACANLAAANLSRGAGRSREFAVRIALGAGRRRLVQQVLIEQVTLAAIGGSLGAWLGWIAVRSVLFTWAGEIPRAAEVQFEPAVLLFAIGVSLVAGILAGLAPALRSSQTSPAALIVGGNRTAHGGKGLPGGSLIALEIAIAFALLTGAALLLRSFGRLLDRDLGFRVDVVTAEAGLSYAQFPKAEQREGYWTASMREIAALPGVSAVGVATWIPLTPAGSTFLEIGGASGGQRGAGYRVVSGGYFEALGIPLLNGRSFDAGDGAGAGRVTVINRRFAEEYWPGENPIGKQVRALSMERDAQGNAPWLTVIGVVGDVRHWGRESEALTEMYVDYRQVPSMTYSMTVVVRGGSAAVLTPMVREKLRALNPGVPVVMGSLSERLDRSLANRRFVMSVLTGFSALALVLAAIGLYAVLAYSVSRRTRELAVRTALGATRPQLLMLVLQSASRVVLVGVGLGMIAAGLLSQSMQVFLVDIVPLDPGSFALSGGVLALIALLATLVPALRATRSDPLTSLQAE